MFIKRVELEDIKSHAESKFEFERGSTSICGENGAGKTTIIEAIAWTLFDLLAYKKDEFLRRGAKKGSVRVTFESGLDEREYTVYRDTNTGYYVYDPALKLRIADKKEEVTRFLWQHLGVEPGTDLEALFRHAIGVPQGTFTAIFLAPAAERKKTFDTLLKVEEYRRGAEELLKTVRFVEGQINAVSVKIARAEGELAKIELIEAEYERLKGQVEELSRSVDEITRNVSGKAETVKVFDEAEAAFAALQAEAEKLRAEKAKIDLVFCQREAELKQSSEAAAKTDAARADAEKHTESLGRLKELEREREAREKLRLENQKVESAIANVVSDRKHLNNDLESIQRSHAAIESLKQLAIDQERLEREVEKLRADVSRLESVCARIKVLDDQILRMRDSYRTNTIQLKEAREKSATADSLANLEGRDIEIIRELASLQATLERDERFQKEIMNGLCPILSQKCLNLKEGETLEMFVTSQFGEIKSKIAVLQDERSSVSTALNLSREAAKYVAQISVLEGRAAEIGDEGKRLASEKAALDKESEDLPGVKADLVRVDGELKALDNPKSKIAVLEQEARREGDIREQLAAMEKNLERLESERRILAEQLESYKDLDQDWVTTSNTRDATADAYRAFIVNEALAKLFAEREEKFTAVRAELDVAERRLAEAEAAYNKSSEGYDRERHLAERRELQELGKRQVELETTYNVIVKQETDFAAELVRLEAIRLSMQDEFREKERLEKVRETTDFIRTTLKEAAPLVARNYVWHVSHEANQMYREITGNAERTLKWTEDYGICLEEGGYDRPFVSLSGGEQMAAALSVRLALLKQLSDIRIAFFDEPTTNMDAERRENLAQQIGGIKHFDQLFVISHDDTFEGYMDHEIRVGKS
jgi:DNA repair protein SbcC/Rad50